MGKHLLQRLGLGILVFSVMLIAGCQLSKIGVQELHAIFEINFNEQDMAFEDIVVSMPREWSVRHMTKTAYSIYDQEDEIGYITVFEFSQNFDLSRQQPNHSDIIMDEGLDFPLGKGRILTLDADNGSAASGKTGTHDAYIASLTIKNKGIYYFELNSPDKSGKLKPILVEMLRSLTIEN